MRLTKLTALSSFLLIAQLTLGQMQPPVVPTDVVARSADAFVESIAMNNLGGPYTGPLPPDGKPYGPEQAKLYRQTPIDPHYLLGIRYYRLELGHSDSSPYVQLYRDHGARIDDLIRWSWRDLREEKNLVTAMRVLHSVPPDMIVSIEGNNEANYGPMSGMKDWPATVLRARLNQDALYPALRADPQLRKIPFLCFCIIPTDIGRGSEKKYAGEKSDSFEFETMHSYQFDSGTSSVELRRTAESVIDACGPISDSILPSGSPARPIITTETGYSSDKPVAERTQARSDPITLVNNFAMGVSRTYLYGSWGNKPWDICSHPAGDAIANLTSLFGEATWNKASGQWTYPDFQPGALRYSVAPLPKSGAGAPVNVHQLLLQKSDGTFYLLLWNDTAIWNHQNDQLYDFPPVAVDLKIDPATPIQLARLHDLQDDGSFKSLDLQLGAKMSQGVRVNVANHVTILELKPAQPPALLLKRVQFRHLVVSDKADANETNPQGLTTVSLFSLPIETTVQVRLTFKTPSPGKKGGKGIDVLLQGSKVAREIDVTAAETQLFNAYTDWRGQLCVQVMDVSGASGVLEKIDVLSLNPQ